MPGLQGGDLARYYRPTYDCSMKVTSKGQVTIPLPIRSEFGLKPGTDVEFVAEGGKVVLRPKTRRKDPVEAWLDEATGVARSRTSTAKVMKLTRGED